LRLSAVVSVVDVAVTTLQVSSQLKSLGVIIDSHMRFDSHVGDVVRACNYHTRAPRLLKRYRQLPAVSPRHESTTATRCCMALLAVVGREAAESSKQRRPGHLSAGQTTILKSLH